MEVKRSSVIGSSLNTYGGAFGLDSTSSTIYDEGNFYQCKSKFIYIFSFRQLSEIWRRSICMLRLPEYNSSWEYFQVK
jgi:hypothetical protein